MIFPFFFASPQEIMENCEKDVDRMDSVDKVHPTDTPTDTQDLDEEVMDFKAHLALYHYELLDNSFLFLGIGLFAVSYYTPFLLGEAIAGFHRLSALVHYYWA
jgi:hypothetical protein